MSMIGTLRAVRNETIQLLLADPQRVVPLLFGAEGAKSFLRARAKAGSAPPVTPGKGLLARLVGMFHKPQRRTQMAPPASPPLPAPPADSLVVPHIEDDGEELDLCDAWHGIHFLLTGTDFGGSPPLNFIVAGGKPIGDVDVGYGPARAFTAEQVQKIAEALLVITPEQLASRFDAERMNAEDIYPRLWDEGDQALGYLQEHFRQLVAFLQRTVDADYGMLVYLT